MELTQETINFLRIVGVPAWTMFIFIITCLLVVIIMQIRGLSANINTMRTAIDGKVSTDICKIKHSAVDHRLDSVEEIG